MVHLNSRPSYIAFGNRHFSLAGQRGAGETSAVINCPKMFFLVYTVYTNKVFNARVQRLETVVFHNVQAQNHWSGLGKVHGLG